MSQIAVPITVIFENDAILAVRKPAGMPSHSLPNNHQISVESIMRASRADLPELSLLHRLDTGTSGVLLFAKDLEIFKLMREKFKTHEIRKFYRAWSAGKTSQKNTSGMATHALAPILPEKFPFLINLPLAHHPKNKKKMIALPPDRNFSARGKPLPAQTIVHAKKQGSNELYEFEVQIITGVMHQIRVHLAYYGFPLIGDVIYGSRDRAGERLGLHAERIEFELLGLQYKIEDSHYSQDDFK